MNFFNKIRIITIIILLNLNVTNLSFGNIEIVLKIENEIITNHDLEKEYKYLIALNKNLRDIDNVTLLQLAKDSIKKEVIKKNELIKYVNFDEKNELVEETIKNFYNNLDINSEEQFQNYLKKYGLNYKEVYKKFQIEVFWNQMIYANFIDQVFIDENLIKNNLLKNQKKRQILKLSEIVYEFKDKKEIDEKYRKIISSIEEIGFQKTALIYSISTSRNNSGSLGWVRKDFLSQNIKEEVEKININEITKPINIPSGVLILKLEDIKMEDEEINIDEEIKKEINRELNYQLSNYSNLYFNKIEKNSKIYEY